MAVAIVDVDLGNLGSVRRAVEECGEIPALCPTPADLDGATHLILPGVGAFRDGMRALSAAGWVEELPRLAERGNIPILGICLGMQLLAERGFEGGDSVGLGLIPGEVRRLVARDGERVPHVGWNEVQPVDGDEFGTELLASVPPSTDFYFVHSYHFAPSDPQHTLAKTPYGGGFSSVIGNGTVFGTQFHPEKSARMGFQVLRNFIKMGS